jgi:hypothetical protein
MQIKITLDIAIRCPMLENADNTVNKIEIHRQRLRDAYGKKSCSVLRVASMQIEELQSEVSCQFS